MSRELCAYCAGSGAVDMDADCPACGGTGFKRSPLFLKRTNRKDAVKLAVESIERVFAEQDEHAAHLGVGS